MASASSFGSLLSVGKLICSLPNSNTVASSGNSIVGSSIAESSIAEKSNSGSAMPDCFGIALLGSWLVTRSLDFGSLEL